MKNLKAYIILITLIVVTAFTIDSRYGLATVQEEIFERQEIHKLEHQEDVVEERLWDLEDRQAKRPTADGIKQIKKIKSRLQKIQREINKELSIEK